MRRAHVMVGVALGVVWMGTQLGCGGVECGEGTVEEDGQCVARSSQMSISTFPRLLSEAYCSRRRDCCTAEEFPEEPAFLIRGFETYGGCVSSLHALLLFALPGSESAELGRLDFQEAEANDLIADIRTQACEGVDEVSFEDRIASIYVPQVPTGGDCRLDAECDGGSCDGDLSACVAYKSDGADCEDAEECQNGVCYEGRCSGLRSDDEGCGRDDQCQSGYCNQETGLFEESVCAIPPERNLGDVCSRGAMCASRNCEGGVCAAAICDGM